MSFFLKTDQTPVNSPPTNNKIKGLAHLQNQVMSAVLSGIQPGITTSKLADIARKEAAHLDLKLSMRELHSFPDDIAICINDQIANAPPTPSYEIKSGDVVKVSIGSHDSMSAFCQQTWSVQVGAPTGSAKKLIDAAQTYLASVISLCKVGVKVSTLAEHLESLARKDGKVLSSIYKGHFIGSQPVIAPLIMKPKSFFGTDYLLTEGSALSISVLLHNDKPKEGVKDDRWTVFDKNRGLSAHLSHIVLLTSNEPIVVTAKY